MRRERWSAGPLFLVVQLSWGLNPELTCVKDNKVNDIWDYGSSMIKVYYYERA